MNRLLITLRYLGLIICIGGFSFSYAQDHIYLLDDTKFTCKVVEIDKKISYQTLSGENEQSVPSKKVAWISLANGDIYVFGDKGEKMISFDHDYYDKILLKSYEIVPAEIKGFDAGNITFINLTAQQIGEITVPKSEILAILYRNKQIIQYNSTQVIAEALYKANQPTDVPYLSEATAPSSEEQAVSSQTNNNPIESGREEINIDNMDQPVGDDLTTTDQDTEDMYMNVSQEDFVKKALDKTRRLTQYIRVITDKQTDKYEANKAVNEAIVLFMSDTCVVQVSNVNEPQNIKNYYIRPYLNHVKLLKYDKVEIEWADINYVGDVRKGPDGNYYGFVTFVQTFRGFKDGNVVYEDKTEKRVEVVLKSYEFEIDGTTKELWDVLLSNIKVDQTYKL